jgi:hypothetical protein
MVKLQIACEEGYQPDVEFTAFNPSISSRVFRRHDQRWAALGRSGVSTVPIMLRVVSCGGSRTTTQLKAAAPANLIESGHHFLCSRAKDFLLVSLVLLNRIFENESTEM